VLRLRCGVSRRHLAARARRWQQAGSSDSGFRAQVPFLKRAAKHGIMAAVTLGVRRCAQRSSSPAAC
jgi:hypothetical protein